MNWRKAHTAINFTRFLRLFTLAGLVVLFSLPSLAQERGGDRPVNNKGKVRETRFKSRNKQGDRPRTKDVAGRRVRTKGKSSVDRARASYPTPKTARAAKRKQGVDRAGKPLSPIYGGRPRDNQKPWKDGIFGRRVHVRSATGQARNVYSNRTQLATLKIKQKPPGDYGRGKKKVVPRSASRAYLRHKSINPIARFSRKHKRGDQAILTDLAGRKPRGKNFETPRQPVVSAPDPYRGRKRIGDRPYRGHGGTVMTSGIKTPKAWKGDITGRRIRKSDARTRTQTGGRIPGRLQATEPRLGDRRLHNKRRGVGYRTATVSGEKRPGGRALPGKTPGRGIMGVGGLTVKTPRQNPRTPGRAGTSRSGKGWNNQGTPLPVRQPAAGSVGAGTFQGNTKWRRPLTPRRAGTSKSGVLWNNKGRAIAGKPPTSADQRAGAFQGNMKLQRPMKPRNAGKSNSGKLWNNDGTPLVGKVPPRSARTHAIFQGNIKGGKPLTPRKAGTSKSRESWNNDGMPLAGKAPPRSTRTQGTFQGNIKGGRPDTPRNVGESKSGVLWNNNETPIKSRPPSDINVAASRYKGNVRLSGFGRSYVKNPNASALALKKLRPEKNTYDVAGIKSRTRSYHYIRNPASADGALKVREPGRAFAKASSYQGNIRMRKFDVFGRRNLHPDSQFVKINKNNVKGEKDVLTGLRLWWSRTFKKNDEQPEHLKAKPGKPRYDKGEEGMWYD